MKDKKLGMARLVAIEKANDLLNKSVHDVLAEFGMDVSPYDDKDYWYREIIYCVIGTLNDENNCPNCLAYISDRDYGWRYCPYCGDGLEDQIDIHEEYKTPVAAKRSEYFEKFGITEFIRFGVKKMIDNIDLDIAIA